MARALSLILKCGVWAGGGLILSGLAFSSGGLLRAGLCALIAAPLLGVVAVFLGFAKEKRWGLAAASASLLIVIGLSVALGR